MYGSMQIIMFNMLLLSYKGGFLTKLLLKYKVVEISQIKLIIKKLFNFEQNKT